MTSRTGTRGYITQAQIGNLDRTRLRTITDWSSRPPGVRMLPVSAGNNSTAYTFGSGLTVKVDDPDSYGGGDYFVNPHGFAIDASAYGAVDFSVDLDSFSGYDNVESGKIWHVFLAVVLGGTDKAGTWCGIRLLYQPSHTNDADKHVHIRKVYTETGESAHEASDSKNIADDFTGANAAIRLQVQWDSAQGFKAYYDTATAVSLLTHGNPTTVLAGTAFEVGAGNVAAGYVQPSTAGTTTGTADKYRAPTEATILCAIGQSVDKIAGEASVVRIVNFNVHSAS